ncbi:MAG: dienelactone hydrolase family protein [Geminicoccaceae bacterium]|nr:dienelactone hydrolase family protein [Geminicoccaceae bacterium]
MKLDQPIIDLWDRFTHGELDRRRFMDELGRLAGSGAAATALLALLRNDYARAATIAPDDPRLVAERTNWPGPDGPMTGYLVRPADGTRRPAVIVIHENRGLNPHIEDVARRLALEGFLVLAVDMLAREGGTPADEEKAREMIGKLDPELTARRLVSAVPFLAAHPFSTGKVGVVGFCWGGWMVGELAVRAPELAAGVVYYGRQPAPERVPAIRAALLLHYAGLDERINAGIPTFKAALEAHGKRFELYLYEGAQHAFNNDTNPARYDRAAAELAWSRTIAFLRRELG